MPTRDDHGGGTDGDRQAHSAERGRRNNADLPGRPGRPDFDGFVAAHALALLRTAWLLTGQQADAEDLLQETLTRVFVNWSRVRAADSPLAYARTILARCHLSGRRLRRSGELPTADLPDAVASQPDLDQRLMLAHALGRLAPVDRAVLVLRYHDGWPAADVAEVLRLSPGAVRHRAQRALTQMRAELGSAREEAGATRDTSASSAPSASRVPRGRKDGHVGS